MTKHFSVRENSPNFHSTLSAVWSEFTKFSYHLRIISWNQFYSKSLFTRKVVCTQCGNYGNSLSRIFGKNFVKVTDLLNKLLKGWFDEIFSVRVNYSFFHTVNFCRMSDQRLVIHYRQETAKGLLKLQQIANWLDSLVKQWVP